MADLTKRRTYKNAKYVISVTDIPSSIATVPYGTDLPVLLQAFPENTNTSDSVHGFGDPEYSMGIRDEQRNQYYTNQKDLNDLVRYLGSTRGSGEMSSDILILRYLSGWSVFLPQCVRFV